MADSIREFLVSWDYVAWYQVNVVWHNSFMDTIFVFARNQWTWAPLYLFLLVFMTKNFGRRGWLWCLGFLITFAIADFTSASLIKPFFDRIRPCNDPRFIDIVHLLVPCGSGKSFPSTHATNHFALGLFAALTLGKRHKIVWPLALFWAILVAYAQVYVGVHFPLDVICGALLGSVIGIITGKLFDKRYKLQNASPLERG
jgi:membrane-associated phospholipid phosphatase